MRKINYCKFIHDIKGTSNRVNETNSGFEGNVVTKYGVCDISSILFRSYNHLSFTIFIENKEYWHVWRVSKPYTEIGLSRIASRLIRESYIEHNGLTEPYIHRNLRIVKNEKTKQLGLYYPNDRIMIPASTGEVSYIDKFSIDYRKVENLKIVKLKKSEKLKRNQIYFACKKDFPTDMELGNLSNYFIMEGKVANLALNGMQSIIIPDNEFTFYKIVEKQ